MLQKQAMNVLEGIANHPSIKSQEYDGWKEEDKEYLSKIVDIASKVSVSQNKFVPVSCIFTNVYASQCSCPKLHHVRDSGFSARERRKTAFSSALEYQLKLFSCIPHRFMPGCHLRMGQQYLMMTTK